MGFLSNLFGFSNPQNASTDDRNSTWNRLFDEGHAIENDFNEFMIQHGITQDVYIFDVEFVNQGSAAVAAEKKRVDSLKEKILEFISEGGCAQYITNVDKMDEYLEKIRYMKEKDMMGIHTQFINSPLQEIKEIVESVERDRYSDSISNTNNINSLSGAEFEVVCKQLIETMGFHAELTKTSGDGGIDIIAYNHQPLLSGKYIIQCKRYSGSVGEPIIRDLYGVVTSERANKGILMTTGTFTTPAIKFAEGKPLELIDHSKLSDLLNQHGLVIFTSNSEEQSINDSVDTAVADFDLDSFMDEHFGFDLERALFPNFEEFEFWQLINKSDSTNLVSYWKMIEILYRHISYYITKSATGYSLSNENLSNLSDLLLSLINPFITLDLRRTDEKLKSIIFYSRLISANCHFLNGNFFYAIENWDFTLTNWIYDDLPRKEVLIYSVLACLNILELPELVDSYYATYQKDIDINKTAWQRAFSQNEWMIKLSKKHSELYSFWLNDKDKHSINTILDIEFRDLSEDKYSDVCDFGIDSCLISDFPNFIVRDGTALILQKWGDSIKNGVIIANTANCSNDRRMVLEYFS